jgi:hypothetical protein
MLGQGTFGCVKLVTMESGADEDGKLRAFALKQLSKGNLVKAKQGFRAVAERNVLRECSGGDFVVQHFGTRSI